MNANEGINLPNKKIKGQGSRKQMEYVYMQWRNGFLLNDRKNG